MVKMIESHMEMQLHFAAGRAECQVLTHPSSSAYKGHMHKVSRQLRKGQ